MNNKLIFEHMDIILLNDNDDDNVFDSTSPTIETKRKSYENKQKSKKIALQVDGHERAMVGQVRV